MKKSYLSSFLTSGYLRGCFQFINSQDDSETIELVYLRGRFGFIITLLAS